jgi:hypothetical protein
MCLMVQPTSTAGGYLKNGGARILPRQVAQQAAGEAAQYRLVQIARPVGCAQYLSDGMQGEAS